MLLGQVRARQPTHSLEAILRKKMFSSQLFFPLIIELFSLCFNYSEINSKSRTISAFHNKAGRKLLGVHLLT